MPSPMPESWAFLERRRKPKYCGKCATFDCEHVRRFGHRGPPSPQVRPRLFEVPTNLGISLHEYSWKQYRNSKCTRLPELGKHNLNLSINHGIAYPILRRHNLNLNLNLNLNTSLFLSRWQGKTIQEICQFFPAGGWDIL
jgi:hypothetical protein